MVRRLAKLSGAAQKVDRRPGSQAEHGGDQSRPLESDDRLEELVGFVCESCMAEYTVQELQELEEAFSALNGRKRHGMERAHSLVGVQC